MQELTEEDYQKATAAMKQFIETISRFESKEACVAYLAKETGLDEEECAKAYDLAANLDFSKTPAAFEEQGEENK